MLFVNFEISFSWKIDIEKKWETEVNKFFYCKKFIFLQGSHLENWHTFGTQVSIGCMKTLVQYNNNNCNKIPKALKQRP